jgi:phage/plasmid-like protein (TIGR03299 family)
MIENNQIAYAGETPWHGIGTQVDRGTSGVVMLQKAGLDWKVDLRSIAVSAGRGQKSGTGGKWNQKACDGFKAVTRATDGRVFMIGTQKYQPLQNREVVEFFNDVCSAGDATMETVGALRDGAVIWALARLKDADASLLGVDELKGYLLLSTSHDGTLATTGRPTQVRVVCNNTLTQALASKPGENSFRLLHNTKWTDARKTAAKQAMGVAVEQVQAVNTLCAGLAKVTIDHSGWIEFMSKLMGGDDQVINPKDPTKLTRTAEMIQAATVSSPGSDLPSAKGTLWGAVNGVTYYADHTRGFSTTTQASRLTAAWFGEGNSLKTRALKVAAEVAGLQAELVTA